MSKLLYDFFTADHRRIEVLLDRATEDIDNIDEELYHQFRTGLLKHIKMEEKVLFPAAQKANGGVPLPLAAKLRLDHGALTSLMVVPPNEAVIRVIRHILEIHDELEEQKGGMYEACENLTHGEVYFLLEQLKNITDVPVHPFNKAEYALEATKRAVNRAGFDYDQILL
ncbi:MAG: hemerythrin domain-containing protein [Saprospiraceae bacterium]|jgi:iron-sulfur cluster repair protein YtfE (RIC family)|nr:hemerythrin domain-containing protein [Saprospiraceae bacterium]